MEIASFIHINKASHEVVDAISKRLASIDNLWAKSKIGSYDGSYDDSYRTSSSIPITGNPGLSDLDFMIYTVFSNAINEYSIKFPKMRVRQDQGYTALKYMVGEEFKDHIDCGFDGNEALRKISGLIYLNDDYEGGELLFTDIGLKIKPSKGDVILFPSNFCFAHSSLPIISGEKYAIVTWFC